MGMELGLCHTTGSVAGKNMWTENKFNNKRMEKAAQ
jgi:hypothetical protein